MTSNEETPSSNPAKTGEAEDPSKELERHSGGALANLSPRAQDIFALSVYLKENVLAPLLENNRVEIASRDRASEREIVLADKHLARQHEYNMFLAKVVAGIVFILLGAAVALFLTGHSVEAMWVVSVVFASAGAGGATYGISHRNQNKE